MSLEDTAVGVLGPGAVGGVLAVRLLEAGVRVVCVARAATAAAIGSAGLTLMHGGEDLTVQPETVELLRERVDLLLITVKAPALDDALTRVPAGAEVIVPLLNGIEHVATIRARVDGRMLAGSVGLIEAYRKDPTTIVQATPAMVMTLPSEADERTVELLRLSGADVAVDGSEREVLWEKLARQAPLAAATALTQRPIGDLRTDPDWRATIAGGIDETCSVAAADGVALSPGAQWEIIDGMPSQLTTSTARDVAAGRPSELDAITGAAVRAGRRLGVPTPILEQLLEKAEERCRAQ